MDKLNDNVQHDFLILLNRFIREYEASSFNLDSDATGVFYIPIDLINLGLIMNDKLECSDFSELEFNEYIKLEFDNYAKINVATVTEAGKNYTLVYE